MNEFLTELRKQTVIVALIYLAIGLLFVCVPNITLKAISVIISIALLAFGMLKIIIFFAKQSAGEPDRASLPLGVVLAFAAVAFLIKPIFLVSIIFMILGLVLIVSGALKMQIGIELKRIDNPYWGSALVASLSVIILGAIASFAPFSAAKTVIILVGVSMICSGAFDLVSAIFFMKDE